MEKLKITFQVIQAELLNMNLANVLDIGISILIVYYISRIAQRPIFRAILSLFGLNLLNSHLGHDHYLYNLDVIIGIGLIAPHIKFWIEYFSNLFITIKALTYNTFTLFLTIWYKIRRVFMFFYDVYKKIDIFFQKRNYDKTKAEYEAKQEKEEKKNQQQNSYYEEQTYQNNYKQEEQTNYKQEQETHSNYYEQSSYNSTDDEFAQFYSSDDYVILGVSRTDDFKTIKRKYRELAKKYHPDKNYEEWDKYNEIFQKINQAYDNLKKYHS